VRCHQSRHRTRAGVLLLCEASLEDGTLTTVLDAFQPATLPVNFVYAAGRFMPIKLRAFLDFAAPRLKARLA
jgi:hypothetical protein